MINPETNEIAIARRLLGMAARIGNSAIPEEIAAEAKAAFDDLAGCADTPLRERAKLVAFWLINFATAEGLDAQEFAARTLVTVTENLRGCVALEETRASERAACNAAVGERRQTKTGREAA